MLKTAHGTYNIHRIYSCACVEVNDKLDIEESLTQLFFAAFLSEYNVNLLKSMHHNCWITKIIEFSRVKADAIALDSTNT